MFTLYTGGHSRDCEGHSRRNFLRAGAVGLGGLTLPGWFAAKAAAGEYGLDVYSRRDQFRC